MKDKTYKFAVFLLDRYDDELYKKIKMHSLCQKGYISQVVKVNNFSPYSNKSESYLKSVCSKIILQINSKLSGVSYTLDLNSKIKDKKLMLIGVDSSYIKEEGTGVAMVSTINKSFTNFYNKEQIYKEEKNKPLLFYISEFIKEALAEYKKFNESFPKGIIIYRQGVSLHQKDFLEKEVENIRKVCKEYDNIFYDYILVNTKTNYKFFEKKMESMRILKDY